MTAARALIAEDEPLLAATLARMLAAEWPALSIVASVSDGISATAEALAHTPDLLFLDIRMPGRNGLEVASAVLDEWPPAAPTPLIVFVTAYDEFAVAAFERAAMDFILKPVTEVRLHLTVARIKHRLAERQAPVAGDVAALLTSIQKLGQPPSGHADVLDMLNVGLGDTVRLVPVSEVLLLEATDKYVNVVTAHSEGLIRISMRELLERLPPGQFLQVHRSIVVRRAAIESATRDELGHTTLSMRQLSRKVAVSRAFAHHFRPM